jgi:2,5-furandicarboxylate decarboxylase 1
MKRADGEPIRDLRDYLGLLDGRGDLMKVSAEVDPLDEMGAFIARADSSGMNKAILFEKSKGSALPVLANTVGSTYRRIAESFGVSEANAIPEAAERMGKIMGSGGMAPVMVDPAKAPCREIVLKGGDLDLGLLPVLRLNPLDGAGPKSTEGRFISSLACSQPGPSAHNLSYHRFELQGRNQGTVWVFRLTGDARAIEEAWGAKIPDPESSWDAAKGKPFPMAYVLGVTPEFLLTGANPGMPFKYNDFAFIGGLIGRPVELVKCETIDVAVPANAEIVVEGIMRPFNWGMQGKYASFNGFYDEPRRRPIFEVTAITMRRNAIFQHVHIGLPLNECNNMAAFFRSVRVFRDVQMVMPNLVDVFVDPAAGCGFTVHLAIKKGRVGEPKMAMLRAYTSLAGFAKHVFVYDHDVDIRNPRERDWALAHRFMADRDLLVIPNMVGMVIDPLAQGKMGAATRLGVYDGHPELPLNVRPFMGVDCTVPLGLKMFDRVVRKPALEARVDELWASVH